MKQSEAEIRRSETRQLNERNDFDERDTQQWKQRSFYYATVDLTSSGRANVR